MAEEPEIPAPETPAPDLIERLEADLEEAKAAIEAKAEEVKAEAEAVPAAVVDKSEAILAAIDAHFEHVVRNTSAEIPTRVHNFIYGAVQNLKATIKSLL